MKYFILSIMFALFLQPALAYDWERIEIPDAQCADGSPYTAFFSDRGSDHLILYFKGGNACWSADTCYGSDPLANLTTVEDPEPGDFLNQENSPVSEANILIVTYCTGDVYLGKHEAIYDGRSTLHNGEANTKSLLNYFAENDFFSSYAKATVFGTSAGALGVIHHMANIAPIFSHLTDKTILLEGAGLHYGPTFWQKFPDAYIADFTDSIAQYGKVLDLNDGNLSSLVPTLCNIYSDWNIGSIQGSRDFVMSTGFGNISPFAHQRLVYSDMGLWGHTLEANDNCGAFIPATFRHTFLKAEDKWSISARHSETRERIGTAEYARRLIYESELANYK